MYLAKFEFRLHKTLIECEQNLKLENQQILLNLQISGGKDSMSLLFAFAKLMTSPQNKLHNKYIIVAQHFNHKQRGEESEEDALFVAKECLQLGVPVYLHSLDKKQIQGNNQNYFRNWRKKESVTLSGSLISKLNCDNYFIVTAHHARDHAETVLIHILRGSGLDGLQGIQLINEKTHYLRPLLNIKYEEINDYVHSKKIPFREDSSNLNDKKYTRNYIRHHILPHFQNLYPDYENSFLKLTRHVSHFQSQNLMNEANQNESLFISKTTTTSNLFYLLKQKFNMENISENSLKNILHEAQLLREKNEDNGRKEVQLSLGRKITLEKNENLIQIT